jgi:hypothetical protein
MAKKKKTDKEYIKELEVLVSELTGAVQDERTFRGWSVSSDVDAKSQPALDKAKALGLYLKRFK